MFCDLGLASFPPSFFTAKEDVAVKTVLDTQFLPLSRQISECKILPPFSALNSFPDGYRTVALNHVVPSSDFTVNKKLKEKVIILNYFIFS
jgi:hypothetical protein